MEISEVTAHRADICAAILSALPDWFGIPSATAAYVAHASGSPMICAQRADRIAGFVSLAEHFDINCEIHSMGVLPEFQRQRIGHALVEAAAARAGKAGFRYLSVKTLSGAHPDPKYAATRAFYLAMGFQPFEVLDDLWGCDLPCLMLVRKIVAP